MLEKRVREERALSGVSPPSGETAGIWLVTRLSSALPWNRQREILETANMELQAVFLPALSGISRELPPEDRGPSPLGDNGSAPSAGAREVISPLQTPAGDGSTECFVGWHSSYGNNWGSQGTQWDIVVFPTEGFSCPFCIVRQFDVRVTLKRDLLVNSYPVGRRRGRATPFQSDQVPTGLAVLRPPGVPSSLSSAE